MSNILLVEPEYRSKFPPLGLMRISTFHKKMGDCVTFVRGKNALARGLKWHRIYVSSLFTWELPRTLATVKYYSKSVTDPSDVFVGGIGATLLPQYLRENSPCTVIEGLLDKPNILGKHKTVVSECLPDYSLLETVPYAYMPDNAYFCRATRGCIRHCRFCAVPTLEPTFSVCPSLKNQVNEVKRKYGEKKNLVLLDNNVLALRTFENIVTEILDLGFFAGATLNSSKRIVDFNQGIDARFITPKNARLLASLCLDPVRLAFDRDEMKACYTNAIQLLADAGFTRFTNYMLYNYEDSPKSLYTRMKTNIDLSQRLGIRVNGFPMKFIPMSDLNRRYVCKGWTWRYVRGLQCILHATHGLVSANPEFFRRAFGQSFNEFLEILAMPDRYIMYRDKYEYETGEADEFRSDFRKLNRCDRSEFLTALEYIHRSRDRETEVKKYKVFRHLLRHHYPDYYA